jgi:hypothetical protein
MADNDIFLVGKTYLDMVVFHEPADFKPNNVDNSSANPTVVPGSRYLDSAWDVF